MDQTKTATFVLLAAVPDCDTSVAGVFRSLLLRPGESILRRWNWKASLFSSLTRGLLFLGVNASAGLEAAVAAGWTEFLYRVTTAGFYGTLTQSFRRVEPQWQATLAVIILLPVLTHGAEFALHWWRATPNLTASIAASVCLTLVSTTFNLYAMRRGVLVVGSGGQSLVPDLRALPKLIEGYILAGPRFLLRSIRRRLVIS